MMEPDAEGMTAWGYLGCCDFVLFAECVSCTVVFVPAGFCFSFKVSGLLIPGILYDTAILFLLSSVFWLSPDMTIIIIVIVFSHLSVCITSPNSTVINRISPDMCFPI